MTPESEILRGFGVVFKVGAGTTRQWYAGQDGVRRWADNDKPVDVATPDAPKPMEGSSDA